VNADGSQRELYDLETNRNETRNLAKENSQLADQLAERALHWRKSLP